MQLSLSAVHSNAYRSSAPRYCTVSLRSFSARCLGCTHSFFSLEHSAAAEVSRLKANGIKDLYRHVFNYNCHTGTIHRSEENIYQTTHPRKVARLTHSARILTHQKQVYFPRMGRSIFLRLSSSPLLHTSHIWLIA